MKSLLKEHFYIIILLLISIAFFHNIIGPGKILNNVHYVNDSTFQSINVKEAISNGEIHLWTPYFYSGSPFMAIPEYSLVDLDYVFILLFGNINLAMNLALISYFFIAGLGSYFVVYSIKSNSKISFLASLFYMFSGFMHFFVLHGNINILVGYSLLPWAFLFAIRALVSKEWIFYSVLSGTFLALQIFAGSIIFFLYTSLILGLLFIFNLIRRKYKKVFLKTILVGFIVFFICITFSAVKLLPTLEFSDLSNRSAGVSKTEFLGEPIKISDFYNIIISNSGFNKMTASLGFVGFILLLFGLKSYRKRIVLLAILLAIISILIATGSFLSYILFKLPGYGQMRHIERAIILFVFSAPILIAFGYQNLTSMLKRYAFFKKFEKIFFVLIILLVLTELFFIQKIPTAEVTESPLDIPILNQISQEKSDFRVINLALKDLIGASGYHYYSQLGISSVKGGGGIWVNEYVNYVGIAQQFSPAKLWGILNAKYIITDKEETNPDFEFVGKFAKCEDCVIWEASGPYLYENKKALPRAYMVDNAVLVLTEDKNIIYSLMVNENFNPANTVLIDGDDLEELDKYDIIFLNKRLSQDDVSKLRAYVENGGRVVPDIFNNINEVTEADLNEMFSSLSGPLTQDKIINIEEYELNKVRLDTDNKKGFLVLSERFAYFPGWEASFGSKKLDILKADNVITSVYLDGNADSIIFKYKPRSYKQGSWISTIAFIIIVAFLSHRFFLRRLIKLQS